MTRKTFQSRHKRKVAFLFLIIFFSIPFINTLCAYSNFSYESNQGHCQRTIFSYVSDSVGFGVDTLPDGRYIWEKGAFDDLNNYYLNPISGGYTDIPLTWSERMYLLGHMVSLALPTAKISRAGTLADDVLRVGDETTDFGKGIAKVIHQGKQGKHISGHNNYQQGKSVLTDNPQKLLDDFHSGNVQNAQRINDSKVRVDFGKPIGEYIDPATGQSASTTRAIIHSGKSGSHIVPSKPKIK